MGQNVLARIINLILFMTVSCVLYHPTGLQMPPLRAQSFRSSSSISSSMHFRLIPVASLSFRLHPFFHPYFISFSLLQDIYLHLSLFSIISTQSISNQLPAYLFTSSSLPPPPSTPSHLSDTVRLSRCFRALGFAALRLKASWCQPR